MSALDRQIEAYMRDESSLRERYTGKAVIYAEDKFQGVYDDPGVATHEALKKFKPGEFLIRVVGDDVLPAKFFLRVA